MAVETRRPPALAMFINQFVAAVFCFLLTIFAFKWIYDSPWLYVAFILFHLSGIYSYAYAQAKIDHRDHSAFLWKNALFIGLWAVFWIGVILIPHWILLMTVPNAAGVAAPFARFWNYPYSYFLYGLENNGVFYPFAALISLLLPVVTSYLAYFLSAKGFSLSEKIYNLVHTVSRR